MARFLKHTACPVCGSSDALAHYADGSTFCFSHGKSTKSAHISPYVTAARSQDDAEVQPKAICLPDDAIQDYPVQALAWTEKYEIGVESLLRNKVYYSRARNQVIFSFLDGDGKLLAYQARNLNPVSKAKRYFTQGDINNALPIYHTKTDLGHSDCGVPRRLAKKIVLVEDCLSAIKVASLEALGADAMPCLGSSISKEKLARLRMFYEELYIFLDGDMYPNALRLSQQAQSIGFVTKVIYSDLDPKEHSRKDLTSLLL